MSREKHIKTKEMKKEIIVIVSFFITMMTQAQTSLYVKTKDGTQTSFAVSGIKKLTFQTGNIVVNNTSGTLQSYDLNTVRYLSFANYQTDVSVVETKEENSIILYPNPAGNSISISYSFKENEQVEITILDIEGRELVRTNLNVETRHDALSLPLTDLQPGIYLCRVQNGRELITKVFVKQ